MFPTEKHLLTKHAKCDFNTSTIFLKNLELGLIQ